MANGMILGSRSAGEKYDGWEEAIKEFPNGVQVTIVRGEVYYTLLYEESLYPLQFGERIISDDNEFIEATQSIDNVRVFVVMDDNTLPYQLGAQWLYRTSSPTFEVDIMGSTGTALQTRYTPPFKIHIWAKLTQNG